LGSSHLLYVYNYHGWSLWHHEEVYLEGWRDPKGGFIEEVVCEPDMKESVGIFPFHLPSGYQASQSQVGTGRKLEREGQKLVYLPPSVLGVVSSIGFIASDPALMGALLTCPSSCWVPAPTKWL